MLGDEKDFTDAVERETGRTVAATWEADMKTGGSLLGKSGLLCATEGGLVFVEGKFGKPGAITPFPSAGTHGFSIEEGVVRINLTVETDSGPVTFTGRERPVLDDLLAAAGLARKPASPPEPSDPEDPPSAPEAFPESRSVSVPLPTNPPPKAKKVRRKAPKDVESLREAKKLAEALFEAVDDGDLEETIKLLDGGADVDSRDAEKQTPLMVACEGGEVGLVRLLLERGADVNAREEDGETPLMKAASYEELECVKALFEFGPDLDAGETYGGQTALMRTETPEIIEALLDAGANLEARDETGQTALAAAANLGWDAKVQVLLDRGADLEARDNSGNTPLEVAQEAGEEVAVAMIRAKMGGAPASGGQEVEELRRTKQLTEEVFEKVEDGDLDGVTGLLGSGAPVDGRDDERQTPLMVACEGGELGIARLLIEKGADLEARDEDGETPLIHAAGYDEPECVRLLLEKGADVNGLNSEDQQTALMVTDDLEVVNILIAAGAQIDARDDCGQTALAIAAGQGADEKVELLLEGGADPTVKDEDGLTPLQIAEQEDEEIVAAILKSRLGQ
ncbi:MAG: ankyrin repeat domain-containing protein [Planctomycetota bacterium]